RSWGGAPVGFMMTKSIRDTAQLLLALQSNLKPMPFQTLPIPKAHIKEAIRAVKGLRIAYSTQSPVGTEVSPEAIEAIENTVRFLRDQGFQVEAADPKIDGQELVR
ncbi:amidase family protein, partial [Aerococcus urinae]